MSTHFIETQASSLLKQGPSRSLMPRMEVFSLQALNASHFCRLHSQFYSLPYSVTLRPCSPSAISSLQHLHSRSLFSPRSSMSVTGHPLTLARASSSSALNLPNMPHGETFNRKDTGKGIHRRRTLCLADRESASVEKTEAGVTSVNSEFELKDGWQWNKTGQELLAYTLLLAAVPIVPVLPRFQWSGAFYFLFLALWSVYVGSHRSLGMKPPQKVTFQQGLAVPLFCSASLFGFYCLLRFFPDLDLRTFISAYLGVAGAVAVASNLVQPLRLLLPKSGNLAWQIDFPRWLVENEGRTVHLTVTPAETLAALFGIGAAIASKQSGAPFTLNNFIAVCIVTELLQLLSLGSFATAAAMLCGLLLYDVFWVFGSSHVFGDNVMVMVATSSAFDGPMKLIFPQFNANAANPYSILGLGDVAAPGLLIALMLRFDRSRSKNMPGEVVISTQSSTTQPSGEPDKTYFVTCIASYVFGLTLTVVANTVSGAAQPALLYLVPSLLFGVFIVAASRSEASLLLDYKDEPLMSPIAIKSNDSSD